MITLEEALEKFEQLDPEVIFIVNGDKFTSKIKSLGEKFKVDFNSVVLFLVVGELQNSELVDFLIQEKQMDRESAIRATEEIIKEIVMPLQSRLLLLNSNPNKQLTTQEEINFIKEIFKERLLEEIKENPLIQNALNQRIIDLIIEYPNLKFELIKLLFSNGELIGDENIMVRGKMVQPQIGNWLEAYVEKKGTNMLDMIYLSDFLTNSNNTKKLDDEAKKLLFSVFITYLNLSKFPEAFKNLPEEQWQIIPVEYKKIEEQKEIIENKIPNLPFTKDQMKNMTAIEKMIAMQEYGINDLDWDKLTS